MPSSSPSTVPLRSSSDLIPLLPRNPPRFGPVVRGWHARGLVILAAWMAVGSALTFAGEGSARAFGLSMVYPGGGFLYTASPGLALLTCALFFASLVLWWGLATFYAPWLVLVVTGAVAAAIVDGPRLWVSAGTVWNWSVPLVYTAFALTMVLSALKIEFRHRGKRKRVRELNTYLATAVLPERDRCVLQPTAFDRRMLAWSLDLALRPVDDLDDWDHGEQWHGITPFRYQFNTIGGALAAYTANLLPNHLQTIQRAQENLVEKHLDIRTWRWWRIESILGNFDTNPDPFVRDNIMFSGFLLDQLGEMEAATGSTKFDEPGSLSFVWRDGRVFEYDHHRLAQTVHRNFVSSELGIFPCEPGWVFTGCNTIAAEGLRAYDVLHSTSLWEDAEPGWRLGIFREMSTPDGALRQIRDTHFGITLGDGPRAECYLPPWHGFMDTAPDMHRRGLALQARGMQAKLDALRPLIKGHTLDLQFTPTRERGTRYLTSFGEWFHLYSAALLLGDAEFAEATWNSFVADCGSGTEIPGRPINAGVYPIGLLLQRRWGRPMNTAELVMRGYVSPSGPVLEQAPWPDLLVSKARSDDGRSLDLVIEPHRAQPGSVHCLTFLLGEPDREHRLTGPGIDMTLRADADGRATAEVSVPALMALTLRPN